MQRVELPGNAEARLQQDMLLAVGLLDPQVGDVDFREQLFLGRQCLGEFPLGFLDQCPLVGIFPRLQVGG